MLSLPRATWRRVMLAAVLAGGTIIEGVPAQQVAMTNTGPRFLLASADRRTPVETSPSQVPFLGSRVTLVLAGASMVDAFKLISRQTGVEFVYGPDIVRSDRHINLHAEHLTLAAVLTEVLFGTGIDVLISGRRQITLVPPAGLPMAFTGTLLGRVTDSATGVGIAGAEVLLEGTQWRTQTDSAGRYRLDADSGIYSLLVRRVGYQKHTRRMTVRDGRVDTVDVVLAPVVTRLQQLVTTAIGQQRRLDIAADVTVISADSVMRTAPIRSVTDLLDNRVPGLTVQRTSGAPGDPARLRLRGVGSVLGNNDPIVIVDGVRVYAQQSASRGDNLANFANSGQTRYAAPSPLDYIDPSTIETIEVLKGSDAATQYGPDAANGVIVITTKKGKAGPTRWTANLEHGLTDPLQRYPELFFRWGHLLYNGANVNCPASGVSSSQTPCDGDSLKTFQLFNDPALTVLGQGNRNRVSLGASGGSASLTYHVTGSFQDEVGVPRLPTYEVDRFLSRFGYGAPEWMQRPQHLKQWGASSTIGMKLGRLADLSLTASLSRTEQQRSSLEQQLGTLMSTYLDSASGVYYRETTLVDGQTLAAVPFPELLSSYYERATANATNFTNSASLSYRPKTWLTVTGNAGFNVIQRSDQLYFPRGPANNSASDTTGYVNDGQGHSLLSTINLTATALAPIGRGFNFKFATGVNYQTTTTKDLVGGTSNLPPGQSLIGGTTQFIHAAETSDATFGWYLEPSIGNSKLNFSSGLRLDGGKSYGANVSGLSLPKFPKLGFSYLVSDEPWFPFHDAVQSLRARLAYGKSSRQPGITDRLRLYNILKQGFVDSQFVSTATISTIGNTKVRPELVATWEGGFDVDMLNNRVTLSTSIYRATTDDALVSFPVAPEINGGGNVIKNIGVVRNTGLELTAQAQLVRSEPLTWSVQARLSRNRNVVVKLAPDFESFYAAGSGSSAGAGIASVPSRGIQIVKGYPLFGRWSRPITGWADANADGVLQPGEIQIGDTAVYMGSTLPNFELGLSTTIALWRSLTVNADFAYQDGLSQKNTVAQDLSVFRRGQQDPTTPLAEQVGVANLVVTDYNWIQTVNVFRFNTVGVSYTVPQRMARLLGAQSMALSVLGSNLRLWTNYRGVDPNVNAFGTGNNLADTGILPLPRTWQVQLNATY